MHPVQRNAFRVEVVAPDLAGDPRFFPEMHLKKQLPPPPPLAAGWVGGRVGGWAGGQGIWFRLLLLLRLRLPTTYYPLPTTYYLLPTTYYLLTTNY